MQRPNQKLPQENNAALYHGCNVYRDPPASSQNEFKKKDNVYLPVQPWFLSCFRLGNDCYLIAEAGSAMATGLRGGRRGKVA